MPNGSSGDQLMTFTNMILSRLNVREVSLRGGLIIIYEGCDVKQEEVRLIDIDAFQGKTEPWFQRFGFVNTWDKRYGHVVAEDNKLDPAAVQRIYKGNMPTEITIDDD